MNALVLALFLIQSSGTVEGTVVRAGSNEPLPETQIVVAPVSRSLRESRVAATNSEGKFQVTDLPAGSYRLFFEHDGFVRGEFGQRSPGTPGVEIEITPGRTVSGIVQPLTATGVIHGRVVNGANDALPDATVEILKASYRDGERSLQSVQSARTNDLGEYRFFALVPGNYFLSAMPAPSPTILDSRITTASGNGTASSPLQNILTSGNFIDPRALDGGTEVAVYFPDTTDPGSAMPIDLRAGASFHAPDLHAIRVRGVRIRGEIVDEEGRPATAQILTMKRSGPEIGTIRTAPLGAASRTFEFSGLLPGVYELNGADNATTAQKLGNLAIAVGAENIDDLRLVLKPVWAVKGRIGSEEPAMALPPIRVQLRGSHGYASSQPNPTAADGTFTLTRLMSDEYRLVFFGLPEDVFVRSAKYGDVDVLNSTLRIEREVSSELDIVISRKTGSLDVAVVDRDRKPSAATTVVLVPDSVLRQRSELYRTATTDSSGRASILNIPPGNYRAFAWAEIEPNAWQNSDVMRQYEERGTAVTITEGSKGTAVVTAIE